VRSRNDLGDIGQKRDAVRNDDPSRGLIPKRWSRQDTEI
jgi:hypothetical protein